LRITPHLIVYADRKEMTILMIFGDIRNVELGIWNIEDV
jgi:hypothetical protein